MPQLGAMVSFIAGLAGGIVVLVLLFWLGEKGVRDGDRPADATVSAVLRDAGQPDERRPVIVATVDNPSGRAVLAGLAARPCGLPAWLAAVGHPLTVTVPRRTARGKFRPGGYDTVGVVPASATVRFVVPVDRAAARYVLTAAVGQGPGRLRLYRLHIPGAQVAARPTLPVPR
jgi:hypothetical protein